MKALSDDRWNASLMAGLFMLVLGFVFPKFIDKHYDLVQKVMDFVWNIAKGKIMSKEEQ